VNTYVCNDDAMPVIVQNAGTVIFMNTLSIQHGVKRVLSLAALVLLANGCARQQSGASASEKTEQQIEVGGPANGFSVNLALSERAKKTLSERKETVVVAGYVTGFPKPGTPKQYVSDMGEIALGQVLAEVEPGGDVNFNELKLRPDALKQVDAQGPQLLINVFSGRRSSKDNLLNCGIYDGSLKAVQGRKIPISCKLIRE
jgi:hypothetical protein